MEFFNDPWVTAIIGGIISGLIVYLITSWLFSKKQDKEYSQKVKTANNALLYTMRPLVVKKQIPSKAIMDSIIESTARNHEINKGDLLDMAFLVDDLIREVMENAFLDSEQKIEFCNKIDELKYENKKIEAVDKFIERIGYQKDRLSSQYVSFILAFTVTAMVITSTLFDAFKMDIFDDPASKFIIPLTAVLVSIFPVILSLSLKRIKQNERDKKVEKDFKINEEID